ncbi:SDR family oxidoreductase [Vibrio sp. SS-MA-C1-2]|uniref:SDR family oxidoreductase n=1 Tax=Vibrio sp. SS-MA-C1-2 TaxID=2908646 RepID=UPI001F1CC93E|nr:SDR family oxidoreductase [Vibrio sp. SS-MA-C1-2]UJF17809.1 SDR family oxidoreductase [Vibrio sp. SS-MA-C1-2]
MSQNILITGANRGIGFEFVKQYLYQQDRIIACCRHPESAIELQELSKQHPNRIEIIELDVSNISQINQLSENLGERTLDLVICNAGMYGPKGIPLGEITDEGFQEVMSINVLAPLLLIQALKPKLTTNSKVAIISSIMGSMAKNQAGGEYIYRASKAAVNSIGTGLSLDLAGDGVAVMMLHPGWVKTDMGGDRADITVNESVTGLKKVITEFKFSQSGEFRNYDGALLPW